MKPVIILGAGGHARVVLDALDSSGRRAAGLIDPNRTLWGSELDGVKIAGGDDKLASFPPDRFDAVIGVGAARDTRRRRQVQEAAAAAGYALPSIVAASAVVARSARLGDGVQVLTRAVVHPGAEIGPGTIINTAAIVEHDCAVGPYAFVGPAAVLCGAVRLGEGAFVGAGAVVLPGVKIGVGALVAAGAVVRRDVAEGATELGRPARRRRR